MSFISRMLKQDAVYWAPNSKPDKYGQPTYASPVAIKARWVDTTIEALENDKEVSMTGTYVYVDRDVLEGGKLKLGLLGSSTVITGAREIIRFEKNPRYRADEFVRKATLSR